MTKPFWGLCRRRQCLVPTWRGWSLLLILLAGLLWLFLLRVHPFLALNAPVPAQALVVEGWAPDYALQLAVAEFTNRHYEKIFVTGGPLEEGSMLSDYKSLAELGAATLIKLGLSTNVVQPVPAPWVRKDRTYASALILKDWLRDHGQAPDAINLLTIGPHARRSRLLFQKAFGKKVTIGVIAIPLRGYDQKHWWRSSQGFRAVSGEWLAYIYARFFFRP